MAPQPGPEPSSAPDSGPNHGPRRLTRFASVVRADNPGPMTLDGTRSYLLAVPGSGSRVVVDPGPDDAAHLARLAAGAGVELVLVTHRHADHTAGSARLRELTGAPVRAADGAFCHGGRALVDGEVIEAAGLRIGVLMTPGHTADSVCFTLPDDGAWVGGEATCEEGATGKGAAGGARNDPRSGVPTVLTGDTVLGRGTTVLAKPDGSLRDYLASLDSLEAASVPSAVGLRSTVGLPGHGPMLPDLAATVAAYRAHRLERLTQMRAVLATLGPDASIDDIVAHVYTDVAPSVGAAARQSVAAQLAFLRDV